MATVPTHTPAQENGLGTAGLVMGIIAAVVCAVPVLGLVGAPLALIGLGLSIPGLLRANAGRASNKGAALAGLILSSLALLACLLWLMVSAFAASDASKSAAPDKPAADVAAKTAAPAGADATSDAAVSLGKAVLIDDFGGQGRASVTVDQLKTGITSKNEFIKPESGNTFVAAHVTIKNVGKQTYENASWFGAKVYTKQGQAYEASPFSESALTSPLPMNVDLKPGGTVDGWILYEIPAKAKVASVVFDDAEWKL